VWGTGASVWDATARFSQCSPPPCARPPASFRHRSLSQETTDGKVLESTLCSRRGGAAPRGERLLGLPYKVCCVGAWWRAAVPLSVRCLSVVGVRSTVVLPRRGARAVLNGSVRPVQPADVCDAALRRASAFSARALFALASTRAAASAWWVPFWGTFSRARFMYSIWWAPRIPSPTSTPRPVSSVCHPLPRPPPPLLGQLPSLYALGGRPGAPAEEFRECALCGWVPPVGGVGCGRPSVLWAAAGRWRV